MLHLHELTKRFPFATGDRLAVDRVSFTVDAGEAYGLLGPNGAGKTTTLRMVLGLLQPTSGYAAVAGFKTTTQQDEVKQRIGLVSSSAGLYPWLTVRELLEFCAALYRRTPAEFLAELAKLQEVLGLAGFLDQRCATLSTGQRQRVLLARALIHDPPLVLLDEPTRGLDVMGTQLIFEYIRHLRDAGKAVVISTHRLEEAERFCDRFGLLHHGRLVQQGTLDELRAATGAPSLVEMFLKYLTGPVLAGRAAGLGEGDA